MGNPGKGADGNDPAHEGNRGDNVTTLSIHPATRGPLGALATALLFFAAACGSGGGETGGTGGNPGTGGGPRGPGAGGNPLDVVLEFTVQNAAATERTETIRASVPFPEGGYRDLNNVVVSGHQTAWHVLQRWADGTVRVAQAQFTDVLQPNEGKTYRVTRDVPALQGQFQHNEWVASGAGSVQIGAQVEDTFGVRYRTVFNGLGNVLQESPLVQVRRHRAYHLPVSAPGIGRDYLTSTFYVTEFRDTPFVLVDWIVGNDYLGADVIPTGNTDPNLRPLGTIDVRRAHFLVRNVANVLPYRPVTENIGSPQSIDGFAAYQVMQDTWLDDAQTRRYRFVLGFEHPSASQPDRERWRTTAQAVVAHPMHALATQPTWYDTAAAGLLGGPMAGPTDATQRAEAEYQSWAAANHFGTWGSRGDPIKTGTTGTPRNHPLSPELARAIQGNHHRMLIKLEQMAWAQAMRPYHLWQLTVGAEQDILLWDGVPIYPGSRDLSRESLGRRALWANDPYAAYRTMTQSGGSRAHGWEHFDHEHWSTDLLFDYWTISGDEWAKEELRQLGQSLKGVMRLRRYATANIQATRAEGWAMQGFVQVALATGDPSIEDFAMRRVREIVDPQRNSGHASRAMVFHSNYPGTRFPLNHRFYMPWQHGGLLYGYLGAYRFWQDPLLMRICEDVITCVEYARVTNYNDPQRGLVAQGLRYYVPVEYNGTPIPPDYWDTTAGIGVRWGDSPLGGAHIFLTGGLYLLSDWASTPALRQRARDLAIMMLPRIDNNARWSKWTYCVPERLVP